MSGLGSTLADITKLLVGAGTAQHAGHFTFLDNNTTAYATIDNMLFVVGRKESPANASDKNRLVICARPDAWTKYIRKGDDYTRAGDSYGSQEGNMKYAYRTYTTGEEFSAGKAKAFGAYSNFLDFKVDCKDKTVILYCSNDNSRENVESIVKELRAVYNKIWNL
ncbi:uncharacterized protein VTP21DRAFT_4297 [Calcarisporiella thermophila]|uniref:uncharacterized protein n=1 Tax=Calcarisporiella thermophila TaxID=911321 RepID=UPI0037433136